MEVVSGVRCALRARRSRNAWTWALVGWDYFFMIDNVKSGPTQLVHSRGLALKLFDAALAALSS